MAEAGQSIVERDVDQLSEISNAEGKQEHGNDIAAPVVEKRWPGWPGESVFRMLVPAQKVGSIIGRKGEFIKKIVEETRARIKILDGPPGTSERAVISNNFNHQYVSKFEELKVQNAVVSIEHCKC